MKAFGEVFLFRHSHMRECYFHYLKTIVATRPECAIADPEIQESNFQGYLKYLESIVPSGTELIVIDCKYNFLVGALPCGTYSPDAPPFLLALFRKHRFRIVHLVRTNILATLVSSILSVQNQKWATADPTELKVRTVRVPTNTLIRQLDSRLQERKCYERHLMGPDVLNVTYEDLFSGERFNSKTVGAVCDFLGIREALSDIPLYKKMTDELSVAVENFEEVKECLKSTPYSSFVDS